MNLYKTGMQHHVWYYGMEEQLTYRAYKIQQDPVIFWSLHKNFIRIFLNLYWLCLMAYMLSSWPCIDWRLQREVVRLDLVVYSSVTNSLKRAVAIPYKIMSPNSWMRVGHLDFDSW
jgi:hypothetical protein